MNKSILVLPGSKWQYNLVEKIKNLGYNVLLVDPNSDAPCLELATKTLQSDIFDIDRVIEFSKDNKIEAVISDECDIVMPVVAKIGEELSLKTLDIESAKLFTDKYLMREFCRKNNLKYPEYQLCKSVDDAIYLYNSVKKPLIIKPLDSNSSKGVFKVNNVEQIIEHFDESMSFSRSNKYVIAERYIEGTEFTIDSIKTPNSHYTLAISEKKHFAHNENIACELLFSHTNPNYDYNELKRINDIFVMNSPLEFGFTHAEYKYENGDFYLIEIAARGGGNMISSVITQHMSGYDTYKYLIDCSLGNVVDADFSIRPQYKEKAAILKFFKTPSGGGKVVDIQGLDILENEHDIAEYMINFKIGDNISDAISDAARIGFYIVCSENMNDLQSVVDKVEKSFKIVLE